MPLSGPNGHGELRSNLLPALQRSLHRRVRRLGRVGTDLQYGLGGPPGFAANWEGWICAFLVLPDTVDPRGP